MKRVFLIVWLCLMTSLCYSQTSSFSPPGMITTEEDGSPESRCLIYTFSNGTMTAPDANGACSINTGGLVDGSGTANFVTKWSDSDTLTDSVIFDDGTNVGIGTTVANEILDIAGGSQDTGFNVNLTNLSTDISTNDWLASLVFGGVDTSPTYRSGASIKGVADGSWGNSVANDAPTRIEFGVSPNGSGALATVMTIKSTGNVGIGDLSPVALLEIDGNGTIPFMVSNTGDGDFLIVTSDGNVGINDTTPDAKLDLVQVSAGVQGIYVSLPTGVEATASGIRVTGYSPSIELLDKDAASNWHIGIDDNDSNKFVIAPGYGPGQGISPVFTAFTSGGNGDTNITASGTGEVLITLDSDTDLLINGGGNVGIGDTTPDALLEVDGNGGLPFMVSNTGDGDFLIVISGGNVGINDSTPTAKLDVNGSVISRGSFQADGVATLLSKLQFGGSAAQDVRFELQDSSTQLNWALGSNAGRQVVLGAMTNRDKNYDHATETNPTLFIHSATDPDSANDEWISFSHDVTNAIIGAGSGTIRLLASDASGYAQIESDGDLTLNNSGGSTIVAAQDSLTLAGGTNQQLRLTPSGSGSVNVNADSDSNFFVGTDMLFVRGSSGNVGIGTTQVAATFMLNGSFGDKDGICADNEILKMEGSVVNCEADAGGGAGAFDDAGDPIVQNTTTKEVHMGDGAGTLAGKVEIGGDADEPQLVIEGFSTQTDDIFIIQQDDDTEVFSVSNAGLITCANCIDSDLYIDASIDTAHYEVASVDVTAMGANSVDSSELVDGSVDNSHMSDNSIDSDEYVDNSIDDAHLNTTDHLFMDVQSGKITGSFITAGARIDAGDPLWRALFSTDSTEEMLWQFTAPTGCCATAVAKITYSMAEDCSSEEVDWEIKIMAVADGESMTSASFDTLNEIVGATACPATADLRDTVSLTLTNFDSGAAGETIVVHIQRDHDDSDDDASGDAQLHEVNIEWVR